MATPQRHPLVDSARPTKARSPLDGGATEWSERLVLAASVGFTVAFPFVSPLWSTGTLWGVFIVSMSLGGKVRVPLLPAWIIGSIVPATYLLVAVFADGSARGPPPTGWAIGVVSVHGVMLLLTAALLAAFPIPSLPKPTGPYTVSMLSTIVYDVDLELENAAGDTRLGNSMSDRHDFNVQVYYPSNVPTRQPVAPYFAHGDDSAAGLARAAKSPKMMLSHLTRTRHWVFAGGPAAPVTDAPTRMPVLLFSHGLIAMPDVYHTFISEVVSHGFVVIAPEHNDGSAAYTQLSLTTETPHVHLTPREKNDTSLEHAVRCGQLQTRVAEMRAALAHVRAVTTEGSTHPRAPDLAPLQGRLDMRRVAVAGHSFGGITAMAYAGAEPATPVDGTVRACVALDPWLFPLSPAQRRRGIPHVPTLAMFGEYFTKWDQSTAFAKGLLMPGDRTGAEESAKIVEYRDKVLSRAKDAEFGGGVLDADTAPPVGSMAFTLEGAEHQNFCDVAFWMAFAVAKNRTIGSVEPRAGYSAINEYALQFLRRYCVRTSQTTAPTTEQKVAASPSGSKESPSPRQVATPDPSLPLTTPDGVFPGVPVRHWGTGGPAGAGTGVIAGSVPDSPEPNPKAKLANAV